MGSLLGTHTKDYNRSESIVGYPYFGKLPLRDYEEVMGRIPYCGLCGANFAGWRR